MFVIRERLYAHPVLLSCELEWFGHGFGHVAGYLCSLEFRNEGRCLPHLSDEYFLKMDYTV